MTSYIPSFKMPYASKPKTQNIEIILTDKDGLKDHLKRPIKNKKETEIRALAQSQFKAIGFNGEKNTGAVVFNVKGNIDRIYWGLSNDTDSTPSLIDGATLRNFITQNISKDITKKASFELSIEKKYKKINLNDFCTGWGLAHYKFDHSQGEAKATATEYIILLFPESVDKAFVKAQVTSICLIRDLINTPANLLGTNELANAAKEVASEFKAKIKIIKGEKLEKDFPLIHTVGMASPRPPQLVDMNWGKKTDPKVTIVGKGIIYDTGGLNLKPGMYMRDMKKDMGGSAHALGLAWMIMSQKLPVQLRVLIPIAENAVAGNSYRPGDILTSRKGLTVEIGDTDAEGRLVVADALAYASEDKPDFMVDFCTLTGAARVALGYDIPAFFANDEDIIDNLRKTSVEDQDPVWPLPLWQGYMKDIQTPIADITNDGSGRAGAIYGGLFLQQFVDEAIDWVHVDCYAWEQAGRAGRPKGGADTGMRALFRHIKDRYT